MDKSSGEYMRLPTALPAIHAMTVHVTREGRFVPEITTTTWFPVLTLLIGYGTKALSDWIQSRRVVARDREVREAARHDQRVAQRITFQRETLLELQEVSMQLSRATGRANHLDEMAYRESNSWSKSLLPDDLDEGYRMAQARVLMLGVRVRNENIRKLADQLKQCSTATLFSAQRDEANRAMATMISVHDELHKRIGELLRQIDSADE